MSVKKISIELVFEDGSFKTKISEAGKEVASFKQKLDGTTKSMSKAEGGFKTLGEKIRDVTATLGLARSAFELLKNVTTDWVTKIVHSNSEIERMTFLLKGMSDAGTDAAKSLDATKSVNTIFDLAKSAPFSVKAITDSFVKLKSGGLDPLDGSLRGLLDSVAAFGGDSEVLHRASIALQQMAGKGVISMEELRQQLGEAVPRAMELLARSMGISMRALVKQISQGNVEAKSALKLLSAEFELTFGGKAQAMMATFSGKAAKLQTNLTLLFNEIGKGGLQDAAKNALDSINSAIDVGAFNEDARALGQMLGNLVNKLLELGRWLVQNKEMLADWGRVLAAIVAVKFASKLATSILNVGSALRDFSTNLRNNAGPSLLTFQQTLRSMKSVAAGTSMPINGLVRSVAGVSPVAASAVIGIRAFGSAVMAIGGWVVQAAAIIYTLISVFEALKSKSDEAGKSMQHTFDIYNEQELNKQKQEYQKRLKELQDKQKGMLSGLGGQSLLSMLTGDAEKEAASRKEALAKVETDISETLKNIDKIDEKLDMNRQARVAHTVQTQQDEIQHSLDQITQSYDQASRQLAQDHALGGTKDADYKAQQDQLRAKAIQDQLAVLQGAMTKAQSDLNISRGKGDKDAIDAGEKLVTLINQQINGVGDLKKALDNATNPLGANGSKKSPYETAISGMEKKLAGLNGKITEVGVNFAMMQEQIASGAFGEITPDQEKKLLDLAKSLDKAKASTAAFGAEQSKAKTASNNLTKQVEDQTRKADELIKRLANPNYVGKNSKVLSFEKSILGNLAGLDPQKYAPAFAQAESAIHQFEQNTLRESLLSARQDTINIRKNLATTTEEKRAFFDQEVERIRAQYNLEVLTGNQRVEAEQIVQEKIAALRDQFERQNETAVEKLLRSWRDVTKNMQDASARWLDDASNKLTDFITTGKLNFADFANSIISDIIRIQMQSAMANALGGSGGGILGAIGSGLGGLFGGGSAAASTMDAGTTIGGMTAFAHTGGVIGKDTLETKSIDQSVFAGAKKFHSGGTIGLASNEVPIIAKKGETVFTEGQMAALKGSMSMQPNIQVNVINESGHNVDAEQKGAAHFDGKQMVLDVVLSAAQSPGKFRDGIRSAVR